VILIPRHYWALLMQAVEARLGLDGAAAVYAAGTYEAAYVWCEAEAATHGLAGVEVFHHYMQRMSARGWGRFTVEAVDAEAGTAGILLDHSAIALGYGGGQGRNVCHVFNAAFRGSMEYVAAAAGRRLTLESREVECAANGAARCRFEVTPRT
jgi:predicted hydrocarbon binding protein